MDLLKTLLIYMTVTFTSAVENTSAPSVTPVPTPPPVPTEAIVETITVLPSVAAQVTPRPEATVSVTPEPVPTITPNMKGYHNLIQGDRGDEVRRLQERLIELGYLPEGSADGAYGGQTRNAVRRFQYYNSLTVDGIAGRATQTNLFENPDVRPYPTEAPSETPEPVVLPTETPVPETPAPVTAVPSETPGAEGTEAPAPGTEIPTPVTAAPAETEAPTETPDSFAKAALPAEDPSSPAPAETETPDELMEDVDLDAEPTGTPPAGPTATPVPWRDIAGWVVLNDSGEAMRWTALEDGVPQIHSPRIQEWNGAFRISLDDAAASVESWKLTDDGGTVILEAAGYTLALLRENGALVAAVDGIEMVAAPEDFSFGEGRFISVDLLTRALDGSWEWDAEEETLMLSIPGKTLSTATD